MSLNRETVIHELQESTQAFEDIAEIAQMPVEFHAEPGSIVLSMRNALEVLSQKCENCSQWGKGTFPMISKYGRSCALRQGLWGAKESCSAFTAGGKN